MKADFLYKIAQKGEILAIIIANFFETSEQDRRRTLPRAKDVFIWNSELCTRLYPLSLIDELNFQRYCTSRINLDNAFVPFCVER